MSKNFKEYYNEVEIHNEDFGMAASVAAGVLGAGLIWKHGKLVAQMAGEMLYSGLEKLDEKAKDYLNKRAKLLAEKLIKEDPELKKAIDKANEAFAEYNKTTNYGKLKGRGKSKQEEIKKIKNELLPLKREVYKAVWKSVEKLQDNKRIAEMLFDLAPGGARNASGKLN